MLQGLLLVAMAMALTSGEAVLPLEVMDLGCWRDTDPDDGNRAIASMEGTDPSLDGEYWRRENAFTKCWKLAETRGYEVFALYNGGLCAGSPTALMGYESQGTTNSCAADGKGGGWGNQVYRIVGTLLV